MMPSGVSSYALKYRNKEGRQRKLALGSVGDSYDNALAESVIGLLKTEVIRRRGPWRSLEAVEFATLEWVDWFNNRRLLEPIGNIPPAEAEERYYAQPEVTVRAA
jgi:transposase InsO family protein